MEVILRLLHGQGLNAFFFKSHSYQRHSPFAGAGLELWLLIRGTQGSGWPRAAAAGLLSDCRIQIATGGAWMLPGLCLFFFSGFLLSNCLVKGGFHCISGDCGPSLLWSLKMLVGSRCYRCYWLGKGRALKSGQIPTNSFMQVTPLFISSQRLLRVLSLLVSQVAGVSFNHVVGVVGELLWGDG